MIIDHIKNADKYYFLGDNFVKALRYLKEMDICALKPGRYEIDGTNAYASVSDYMTSEEKMCKLEGHRCYADIQYIASGEECIGYEYIMYCSSASFYDEKKDIEFFK